MTAISAFSAFRAPWPPREAQAVLQRDSIGDRCRIATRTTDDDSGVDSPEC